MGVYGYFCFCCFVITWHNLYCHLYIYNDLEDKWIHSLIIYIGMCLRFSICLAIWSVECLTYYYMMWPYMESDHDIRRTFCQEHMMGMSEYLVWKNWPAGWSVWCLICYISHLSKKGKSPWQGLNIEHSLSPKLHRQFLSCCRADTSYI